MSFESVRQEGRGGAFFFSCVGSANTARSIVNHLRSAPLNQHFITPSHCSANRKGAGLKTGLRLSSRITHMKKDSLECGNHQKGISASLDRSLPFLVFLLTHTADLPLGFFFDGFSETTLRADQSLDGPRQRTTNRESKYQQSVSISV